MPRPSPPSEPPTVLILGGTPTLARPLALYLLNPPPNVSSNPLAAFIRIADRFSVSPPSTYLDRPFRDLLDSPEGRLEYQQVNLAAVQRHTEVFTPPKVWKGRQTGWGERGFEVVFDLTGELGFDKPEIIQISNTHALSLSLARSAASLPSQLKPKAYVRLTYSFYEMKSLPSSSAGHSEHADLGPDGVRGRWWHETLRGLGAIRGGSKGGSEGKKGEEGGEGLNIGVIRSGAWYGPGGWGGEVVPRLVAGHVYQYLDQEMKFLYNLDLAQALYLLSLYLLSHPLPSSSPSSSSSSSTRSDLVKIPFAWTPLSSTGSTFSLGSTSKDKRASIGEAWKNVPGVIPSNQDVYLPVFNVVDDANSTQGELGKAVAEVWGIKYGFLNSTMAALVQQFAKTDFLEMVEDVNEMHVEAWSKMLEASNPPIDSTPISPFLDEHAFRKMAICLDGSKARSVLGFKPLHPRVEVEELRRIVKGFQEDGLW